MVEMSFIKYFNEDLDPEILEKAKRELGETDEIKALRLKELKELIKGEPDFYPCTDDIFLLTFLRFRKYDVNRAFTVLKNYYNFTANYTDFLPSDLEHLLDDGITTLLQYRGFEDESVVYQRSGIMDMKHEVDEYIANGLLAAEIGIAQELTQFTGYSVIFDLKGFDIRKTIRFAGFSTLYKLYALCIHGSRCRIKGVHVVNTPVHVEVALNTLRKCFLTEKQKKRFHVHGSNMESLHKFLSPDILPEELGGKQGPAAEWAAKYKKIALGMEDYIISMRKYGYKKNN